MDNPRYEGYPTLYEANVDGRFYTWIVFKAGNWRWWEKENAGAKPEHLSDEIGWKIIAAWYQ